MNHKASIYTNPLIPANLYYCKLLDVHLDTSDRPFLWACLLTGPCYHEYSGLRLASIIYRSPKSEELIEKFRKTFRIEDDALEAHVAALGRWGCVSIFPREYQAEQFSCVGYVTQNPSMRGIARLLEERQQIIGGIEWPEYTDPTPACPKRDLPSTHECPQNALEPTTNAWNSI